MKRHRPVWLLAVVLLALCVGCKGKESGVRIGQHEWRVEVAADPEVRHRGLGGRDELPEGTGMLFVFPDEKVVSFHMLDCRVPLDVAFINSRMAIVEIRTMAVEADPGKPTCLYSSRFPARYALEVAGGTFRRLGVKPGDRAELLWSAEDAAKGAR